MALTKVKQLYSKEGGKWNRGCVMETVPFGVSKFILCSGTMQPKFEKKLLHAIQTIKRPIDTSD
jgi:hypothetical protein